jgi:hypothetical protein
MADALLIPETISAGFNKELEAALLRFRMGGVMAGHSLTFAIGAAEARVVGRHLIETADMLDPNHEAKLMPGCEDWSDRPRSVQEEEAMAAALCATRHPGPETAQ